MTKGLRFQTKLMLTLGVTIAGVTIALIAATEAKVRQAYTEQFERQFVSRVTHLEKSREERAIDYLALSSTLAKHPFVVATLKGQSTENFADDFWKTYLASFEDSDVEASAKARPGSGKSGSKGSSLQQEFLARFGKLSVINLKGEETNLFHPRVEEEVRKRSQRFQIKKRGPKDRLQQFIAAGEQQILYHPTPARRPGGKGGGGAPAGDPVVREMVATPVTDPESGERIGVFLRGASAETQAQKTLEDYQREFGDSELLMIFIGDRIYSNSMAPELRDEMEQQIGKAVEKRELADRHEQEQFEVPVAGEDYLIHLDELTAEDALRPAYQLAALPLASLQENLADLRVRGSGIGAVVLLIALGLGWFHARNLSSPLHELARGTEAIQAGDFDYRVERRTSDEIGELADSFNEMAEELKQKALYRELLGKVSDESVAQALVSGTLDLELGGELKEVSVLFCDIRGFTGMTEHMPPTDVIEMLNEHMTAMTEVVRSYYGVVDKFVGDEIMAVFGALKSYGDDASLAARCALGMIRKRDELNATGGHQINIGIGVATGEAVAGCMGASDRLNYTVLGARVNLAARLCSAAGKMEAVIDDATYDAIRDCSVADPLTNLELKGFANAVSAYHLHSITELPVTETPIDTSLPAAT